MTEVKNVNEVSELKLVNKFIAKVYLWMAVALSLSGFTAYMASKSPALIALLFGHRNIGFIVLCVLEIILVFWLSSSIRKISAGAATFAFILYSVINGLTLSSIFIVYSFTSIFIVFLISAAMFAAMAIYGSFSKRDLRSFGRYFTMALIGLMIAIGVNLLLAVTGHDSSIFSMIISIATVLIFTGLTAYDAQKLMKASQMAENQSEDVFHKASVIGALELYIDFINIFLALLRLFGRKK